MRKSNLLFYHSSAESAPGNTVDPLSNFVLTFNTSSRSRRRVYFDQKICQHWELGAPLLPYVRLTIVPPSEYRSKPARECDEDSNSLVRERWTSTEQFAIKDASVSTKSLTGAQAFQGEHHENERSVMRRVREEYAKAQPTAS
ncbi:hypothetical protein GN244_ATG06992 [Phytophthora infestans]|uniref:Uncharacterized protein n=1 Tax=Phytophthora infestans TaxID=4787 RepID=A0A833SX63_PHYIN|nr:hypothetical protein GN244_ATG06992 [Phytophthora infestans]